MKQYKDYPSDIRKTLEKRYLIKIIKFASIFIIFTIAYIFIGFDYISNRINELNAYVLYVTFIIIAFFATDLHKDLFDHPWEGTVKHVRIETVITSSSNVNLRGTAYKKNIIYAMIELENGKIIDKQIRSYTRNNESRELVDVGDIIKHYKGCKFYQIISKKNKETCSCVMCGAINPCGNKKCQVCDFSLMD